MVYAVGYPRGSGMILEAISEMVLTTPSRKMTSRYVIPSYGIHVHARP
nr:MAG TPA: hypothetical protein [Caudoviricetes sp.]